MHWIDNDEAVRRVAASARFSDIANDETGADIVLLHLARNGVSVTGKRPGSAYREDIPPIHFADAIIVDGELRARPGPGGERPRKWTDSFMGVGSHETIWTVLMFNGEELAKQLLAPAKPSDNRSPKTLSPMPNVQARRTVSKREIKEWLDNYVAKTMARPELKGRAPVEPGEGDARELAMRECRKSFLGRTVQVDLFRELWGKTPDDWRRRRGRPSR